MSEISIVEKLKRFVECNQKFFPYIEKVLLRLQKEIRFQGVLEDLNLEIISFKNERGFQATFKNTIKSIIGLNESILELAEENKEDKILYCIVHEIAHKIAGKGKTGLLEMEGEDLLIQWGFENESKIANNKPPFWERKGYRRGYKWGSTTTESLEYYEGFFEEWNLNLGLTPERWDESGLMDSHNINYIHFALAAMGDLEPSQDRDIDTETLHYFSGLIHGVMVAIKEKKQSTKGGELNVDLSAGRKLLY